VCPTISPSGHVHLRRVERLGFEEYDRSLSRTEAAISPMTSVALLGYNDLEARDHHRPVLHALECCAPNRRPPPLPERITSGTSTDRVAVPTLGDLVATIVPADREEVGETLISAMGRSPVIDAPIARRGSLYSEIDYRRTAVTGPTPTNLIRPIPLNTPPSWRRTVFLPKKNHRIRHDDISWRYRAAMASRNVSCAMYRSVRPHSLDTH